MAELEGLEWQSATQIASRIRTSELTALQCVNYFASRIERLDTELNLVVLRLFESARTRAKQADADAAKGVFWGPLHGALHIMIL